MGILNIKKDGQFEREYPLMKERIRIGRVPENDIRLDDPSVSSKHAMIITILSESFVEDLGSTNGTFVNGDKVTKHELKDHDVIQIGKWEMAYQKVEEKEEDEDEDEEESLYDGSEFERTVMVQGGSSKKIKNRSKFFLKLMSGPEEGKEYEMRKSLVTLGQKGKQLAVVSRRPEGYFFTHVEGTGADAPLINNQPPGPTARKLYNEDVIALGGFKLQVKITD